MTRDIERIVAEVERDYERQKAAGHELYAIPMVQLCRLLALEMRHVPEQLGQFVQNVEDCIRRLPASTASRVLQNVLDPRQDPAVLGRLFRETRWHSCGCPAVSVEARLAAALMLTEAPSELQRVLEPPWQAFAIALPERLIEPEGVAYTHVLVHRYRPGAPQSSASEHAAAAASDGMEGKAPPGESVVHWGVHGMSDERARAQGEGTLADLVAPRGAHLGEAEVPGGGASERLVALFARLAVGACLLAQSAGALRPKSTKKKPASSRAAKSAPTSEYVLGQKVPVGFDGAEFVKAYVRGQPQVTTTSRLVTGSWREEPCGPDLAGRRRTWIMPHAERSPHASGGVRAYEFTPSPFLA